MIKVETTVVIVTSGYIHDGKLKSHPCELGCWWGEQVCKEIDLNSDMDSLTLPEGEYTIKVILEKTN